MVPEKEQAMVLETDSGLGLEKEMGSATGKATEQEKAMGLGLVMETVTAQG